MKGRTNTDETKVLEDLLPVYLVKVFRDYLDLYLRGLLDVRM